MRFTLLDPITRTFTAERMFYSGDGGWLPVSRPAKLSSLARQLLPYLGKDSFFELV